MTKLDFFFTKTACEIDGFIPLVRPITPCSTSRLRWTRSEEPQAAPA